MDHFTKFFKKVKKRQLKRQGLDTNLPIKKVKAEVDEKNSSTKFDLNTQKKISTSTSVKSEGSTTENFTIIGDHSFSKNDKVNLLNNIL